jgi:hypothetical protein
MSIKVIWHIKGKTKTECVREYGANEYIWVDEGGSNR